MKKTSKLLGAVALSATLAMGTAIPAFAADAAGATDDIAPTEGDTTINDVNAEDLTAGSKNTIVKVSTHTSQITVTVPVALPVVADTTGGYGLSPNNYSITNESVPDIEVTSASWNIIDGAKDAWNLAGSEYEDRSGSPVNFTTNDGRSGTPSMGSLFLSMVPGAFSEDDEQWTDDEDATLLKINGTTGSKGYTQSGSQADLGWIIKGSGKAATEDEQTQLLHVTTSSSVIAGEQEASDVIAITYTVALA